MTPTLFATLKYQDARKAMTWLADAFGLQLGTYSPESGDTVDHAEMVIDLQNTEYGSRVHTAQDFEGHLWSFGTYTPEWPTS